MYLLFLIYVLQPGCNFSSNKIYNNLDNIHLLMITLSFEEGMVI